MVEEEALNVCLDNLFLSTCLYTGYGIIHVLVEASVPSIGERVYITLSACSRPLLILRVVQSTLGDGYWLMRTTVHKQAMAEAFS